MSEAVDYALSCATDDVAATIRWIEASGFELRSWQGGVGSGNVQLVFERAGVGLSIVRDRGQWMMDVTPPGQKPLGLQVLLTAMRGGEAEPGPPRPLRAPLPDQLPEGVSWSTEVPALTDWLESEDRTAEIKDARSEEH